MDNNALTEKPESKATARGPTKETDTTKEANGSILIFGPP
jgi:hypothetical protein